MEHDFYEVEKVLLTLLLTPTTREPPLVPLVTDITHLLLAVTHVLRTFL